MIEKNSRIFIAGHQGLVGAAVLRLLKSRGYLNLCYSVKASLDLRDRDEVFRYFDRARPEGVIMCAGRVGGIGANQASPVEFLAENLAMGTNVIEAADYYDVERFVYLGSSCIYPRINPQPITEDQLLSGRLEPTNEGYAIAKITCVKLCETLRSQHGNGFVALMPTNLYGPGDRYEAESSHVIPALLLKMLIAKKNGKESVVCWGSGEPLRELLYVDDLASACVLVLQDDGGFPILNVGSGEEISIHGLAEAIAGVVGYEGRFEWDESKPDGVKRKLLCSARIRSLGWRPKTSLALGLKKTLKDFQERIQWVEDIERSSEHNRLSGLRRVFNEDDRIV